MENVQPLATVGSNGTTRKTAKTEYEFVASILGRKDVGTGRFFKDKTYHHAVRRALNQVAARGADISEVLQATTKMQAGDEQSWHAEWSALAERNLARANSTRNRKSRGEALLRAHTYYARAQFYLPPDDAKRPVTYDRCRKAFYEGLDTLGVTYEKIDIPYGPNTLKAVYYPAAKPVRGPLIVFHGGYDTIVEELYFFLAAEATSRGYSVLTFDGPGQGAPLREQGLQFSHEWDKPTSAVLDTFLATHDRPEKIVLIGLSMGGYLAPRAAAFEPRFDGVVSYDICYDVHDAYARKIPKFAEPLRRWGLGKLVDQLAALKARSSPELKWALSTAPWTYGTKGLLEMVDHLAPFTLAQVAHNITQDVMILVGAEDQFIPTGQVAQFQKALVNARSVTTKIYDRASGGHEHSQLGAPTLWHADFFDWIEEKFGAPESNKR
ncbi:MAG TPA: alpha/beta fold hydrolase [Candidatus Sulfotelmatobacter sp.]|nr:alpha/beta fold hydrolase [Candidatus Sulfotelmatobacter sp.]